MKNITSIKLKGRELKPHKAIISPLLNSRTVLTNSPWNFVELWLKREKQRNALFYWNQAHEFHKASFGLPTQSAPLLHYYSFMNAVKALLTSKGIAFNQYHGIKAHSTGRNSRTINLRNEGVKISNQGILPSLSLYLGENEPVKIHSLQELLYNLPYIHRTYCLTYSSQTDMFIPVKDCQYVIDRSAKQAFLIAKLSKDFSTQHIINRFPTTFSLESKNKGQYLIKSSESATFSKPNRPTRTDLRNLTQLHQKLRLDLCYINGAQTLWYIKTKPSGPSRLSRFPVTITFAIMHRLSELCRYRPLELASFLSGQKNWLLSEFIEQS
ncbi:hypothetical protein GWN26_08655, partial [Candidatus Saccharibacteria bacterium]|nr:hypothetical protein [Calditrichia bacterium]NIV72236.1 hypothetical protein [Calditrichia bacterium]NIV99192.1 hypothetical protein [Candidatus Saccharibacteria bacterium]NIW79483.1 hypothetical protein [Calditrichia bacterium]